ncbi:hypothetical protein B6U99_00280 [Candidatus Geothermarchaeota archaeon ex4572_27]|nr:MAG: hypothetical protein B6U99_00280 [Candidatus Geothermarchaeota archaeon ex4572_27]
MASRLTRLDAGVLALAAPYALTLAWAVAIALKGVNPLSPDGYRLVGKDPLLFVLSSLCSIAGALLLADHYGRERGREGLRAVAIVLFAIASFNVLASLVIASAVAGGVAGGAGLFGECCFIPMYNLLLLAVALMLLVELDLSALARMARENAAELSLVALLACYLAVRAVYGASFELLVGGVVALLLLVALFRLRR